MWKTFRMADVYSNEQWGGEEAETDEIICWGEEQAMTNRFKAREGYPATRADLKDQRYIEECRESKAHRQECLCH